MKGRGEVGEPLGGQRGRSGQLRDAGTDLSVFEVFFDGDDAHDGPFLGEWRPHDASPFLRRGATVSVSGGAFGQAVLMGSCK